MEYDPVKDALGRFFRIHPVLQRVFFALLHTVFLRSWYVRREVHALLDDAPAGRHTNVLDAGTGFGQYAAYIAQRFPRARVLAVDVKPDYLADLRRFVERTALRDRIAFREYDLTGPPLDQAFDLIVSVDVMEHIEDDRTVFRNFAQMLTDGGHVIVNTPSDQGDRIRRRTARKDLSTSMSAPDTVLRRCRRRWRRRGWKRCGPGILMGHTARKPGGYSSSGPYGCWRRRGWPLWFCRCITLQPYPWVWY